jgi:hypothetical protein
VFASLLCGSSRATAETVSLGFQNTTGSAPVGVQFTIGGSTQSASITPGPYYWQQTGSPMNSNFGAQVATFCVELNQGFPPTSGVFTVDSLGSVRSAAVTDAIQKLWANNYSSSWAARTFAGSTASTAFQLALWELVYDGPGGALGGGNFRYTGSLTSGVGLAAANMLAALSTTSSSKFASLFPTSQLVWLSNGSYQDQLTIAPKPAAGVVPAPPSIVLAGLALCSGLFGRSLRRRKEVVEAVK